MMYSVSLMTLRTFLVLAVPDVSTAVFHEDVADKFVARLDKRVPNVLAHHMDLDSSTVGKPGIVARPSFSQHNFANVNMVKGMSSMSGKNIGYESSFTRRDMISNHARPSQGYQAGERMVLMRQSTGSALPVPAERTYDQLSGVQVTRASDGKSMELTSLWRKDLAFGMGGERAVVVFLRHFG
eukprot:gnl/MRDRNA2_/MRDRNA2_56259_c0_seq1.p1 gnl/MRDRNA2_/MRDRNA2_56259_c0~~gnl/MRDRNA2_/MRDRNA2_56259_c0_seq1.p1  ORF type:complete len:183 (+),score=21.44 gnl/MRDRNA2_/MRDRNA2_56259_c0_seq1:132-680(+)